ncbi:MAG: hydrogenase maturation nickel metallochaperone HypA [Planctomycetaceae bacterium]|nr:hydrogenase maturation nickel metallochaperone HypA [Planctomycetaceae bacterium]
MHELSIALSILGIAEEEAGRHGNPRVIAVQLKLGPLSGVVPEALLSAWELAREGSPLEGARLDIEVVPVTAICPQCKTEVVIASIQQLCCSACGTPTPGITGGRELEVTALEIEDDCRNPARSGADAGSQAE